MWCDTYHSIVDGKVLSFERQEPCLISAKEEMKKNPPIFLDKPEQRCGSIYDPLFSDGFFRSNSRRSTCIFDQGTGRVTHTVFKTPPKLTAIQCPPFMENMEMKNFFDLDRETPVKEVKESIQEYFEVKDPGKTPMGCSSFLELNVYLKRKEEEESITLIHKGRYLSEEYWLDDYNIDDFNYDHPFENPTLIFCNTKRLNQINNTSDIRSLFEDPNTIQYLNDYTWNGCMNALGIAAHGGDVDIVKALIDLGCDTGKYRLGWSALHLACEMGNYEVVNLLLEHFPVLLENNTEFLQKPLHLASRQGRIKVVMILLEAGCEIDCLDVYSATPLHYACNFGHYDVVKTLLKAGCNVDALTTQGRSPLAYACRNGSLDTVQALIEAGCTVNFTHDIKPPDWELDTTYKYVVNPLHIATWYGKSSEVVKALIEAGASIDEVDINGNTALELTKQDSWLEFSSEFRDAKRTIPATTQEMRNVSSNEMNAQGQIFLNRVRERVLRGNFNMLHIREYLQENHDKVKRHHGFKREKKRHRDDSECEEQDQIGKEEEKEEEEEGGNGNEN